MRVPAAAWGFVAPALLVIALFFLLPVLAGFALSVTDFDLYALADLGNLPPRRTTWNDPALGRDVHARAFRDQLERVRAAPQVPEWERIAQEMQLAAERVVRGGEDIEAATADLDARVDAILEKRRWLKARGAAR